MTTGNDLLKTAKEHIGERYILGTLAPKDNPRWKGPWDCAEFVSWVAYQVTGVLYGCSRRNARPSSADAYTGYWARDAKKYLERIPLDEALRTPGAILLRIPAPGLIGHIVLSDGKGGTIEAHSTERGVIAGVATGRRWDTGLLIPDIRYRPGAALPPAPTAPVVLRLQSPHVRGVRVKALQQALKKQGFDPGPIDGDFGPMTAAAVAAYQLAKGLVPDGEAGPVTFASLGL